MIVNDFNNIDNYVKSRVKDYLEWIRTNNDEEAMETIIETCFIAGAKWQKNRSNN